MQLKNLYSPDFYDLFTDILLDVKSFDKKLFVKNIFDKEWKNLELKDRLRHTSKVLKNVLDPNPTKACDEIVSFFNVMDKKGIKGYHLELMFFPDYIENNCLENLDKAMVSFTQITEYTSCEFAIRPFIIKYPEASLIWTKKMALHDNEHVRRLASEGTRPRLPWAMALPFYKKDPTPILPILITLQDDPSEYVRRSVANNLNDISKDNPQIAIDTFTEWHGQNDIKDKLVKHGARTLLKAGDPTMMTLFNYGNINDYTVRPIEILTDIVKINDYFSFQFELTNDSDCDKITRLEYGIYFLKSNGQNNKKVFKISERVLKGNESLTITKKHSFKIISTRKYYPGVHYVSLIVNGITFEKLPFTLC